MSLRSWKKTTDLIVTSIREEMVRLKTYYRHMGSCWDCKKKLAFYDYDRAERATAWRIAQHVLKDALREAKVESRAVPVCMECHQRRAIA